jgi:hypothetical protein
VSIVGAGKLRSRSERLRVSHRFCDQHHFTRKSFATVVGRRTIDCHGYTATCRAARFAEFRMAFDL